MATTPKAQSKPAAAKPKKDLITPSAIASFVGGTVVANTVSKSNVDDLDDDFESDEDLDEQEEKGTTKLADEYNPDDEKDEDEFGYSWDYDEDLDEDEDLSDDEDDEDGQYLKSGKKNKEFDEDDDE